MAKPKPPVQKLVAPVTPPPEQKILKLITALPILWTVITFAIDYSNSQIQDYNNRLSVEGSNVTIALGTATSSNIEASHYFQEYLRAQGDSNWRPVAISPPQDTTGFDERGKTIAEIKLRLHRELNSGQIKPVNWADSLYNLEVMNYHYIVARYNDLSKQFWEDQNKPPSSIIMWRCINSWLNQAESILSIIIIFIVFKYYKMKMA